MAFDKIKTLRAAEKALEIGKIPTAIKEYCKLIENEPDDFTTLNILGDLYVRVGNTSAAVSCFRRIADHYRAQDFALKAIAMFKKIDRLQPASLEIAGHLADLYAQQDLLVEARAHYLMVANAHAKSGNAQAGLEVLQKTADLDPQNTEIRIQLAEGYLKQGMMTEAATSFTAAGQALLTRNDCDQALELFAKALGILPGDYSALRGLLAAHTAHGTADEAAETIARASTNDPEDIELLSILVSAHVVAENAAEAETTANALVAKNPNAYEWLLEVARLYLRSGEIGDAVRITEMVSEQMLTERQDEELLEFVNEILTSDVDNVPALRLIARLYSWQQDTANLKVALERLADAAQVAGLDQDERYALTQLGNIAPDNAEHVQRLNELGGAERDENDAQQTPFGLLAEVESQLHSVNESVDELTPWKGETGFEYNSVAVEAEVEYDAIVDVNAGVASDETIEHGFAFEMAVTDEITTSPADAAERNESEDRHAQLRAQELESVDFYIAQGYIDIAVDSLNLLESQFGKHPDIDRRRQQLTNGDSDKAAIEQSTQSSSEQLDASVSGAGNGSTESAQMISELSVSAESPGALVIDSGLAEMFEQHREFAEAESNGDYETHYNLGLAYKEMDLFEEALEEFQIAVRLVSPEDGTRRYLQCCNLVGHCFLLNGVPQLAIKWFNKGLSAPSASEDERQALRFDLAAAYEQMGELNRAMDLFTEVYGVNVSYRGVNERLRALQSRLQPQPVA